MCLITGSNIRMPPTRPEMWDYRALTMTLTSYARRNLSLILVLCHFTVDFQTLPGNQPVSSRTIEKRFNFVSVKIAFKHLGARVGANVLTDFFSSFFFL